jgi:hypothetical protein
MGVRWEIGEIIGADMQKGVTTVTPFIRIM